MEYIWRSVPKEEKGGIQHVVYVKGDIPFLYYSGLVDTERFTLEHWQKAFEDCLGDDGRYWVTHEKMLALGMFRYSKILSEPFDPLKMRTGKYAVERLWKVYERSIIPSCALPKEYIKNVFDQVIRQKKSVSSLISKEEFEKLKKENPDMYTIDADQKATTESFGTEEFLVLEREHLITLKKLLDMYPSPRRKLEISVYDMRREKLQELADIAAKPQKSSFEAGPDFRKTTQTSLKDLLVKASENTTGGRKPMDEVIDLKSMQKKKRPPVKF